MLTSTNNMILIEGAATYERILEEVREVETEEGIRHIQDFLKIYPEFAKAHNDLAVMYYRAGNSLKTLAHYEKAHKLDPGNITYRKNLADFYFVELEWTGEAIHSYLDILKDNPFDTEALNALGTISFHIGRKEQARQYFSRTLQLDTSNQGARQAMEQFAAPVTASQESRQLLQGGAPVSQPEPAGCSPVNITFQSPPRMVKTEPSRSTEELYREAIGLANVDRLNDAIRMLEELVAQDAGHALAHNDMGVFYQKTGELQKSRLHHEEAVRLQSANEIFQKNLADLLYRGFGDLEEALTIYVRLFAENRYDIEILKAIAHICLEVDKQDDARFFLKQILSIRPWDQETNEALRALETANSGIISR